MSKTLLDKHKGLESYLESLRDELYCGAVKAQANSRASTDNMVLAKMFDTLHKECVRVLNDNLVSAEDRSTPVNYDNPSYEMFMAYDKEFAKDNNFASAWNKAMAVARDERG